MGGRSALPNADFRLYAALVGVLVCALGLAALLTPHRWVNAAQTPKRFLGLDEPAQQFRTRH